MSQKPTTRDLIGELIDLEEQLEYVSMTTGNEKETAALVQTIELKKTEITRKVQGIDHFVLSLTKKEALNKAEIDTLSNNFRFQYRYDVPSQIASGLNDFSDAIRFFKEKPPKEKKVERKQKRNDL